ncbi:MAG: helicase-related protein [Halofilum sp. (in: g-proteobacteria)]|nr:helicase-related protein [Halofilum sp. (in: g-proteobacteria)]
MWKNYADLLRRECERLGVPLEFFPHHGSLSKDLREHVETALKADAQPVTAVCTSTLEMGIDIGAVASIAQIGPPHQVASMRQRLGRSGRRGDAAVLRSISRKTTIDDKTSPPDRLRPALFQAVAMTELLLVALDRATSGWRAAPVHAHPADPVGDRPARGRYVRKVCGMRCARPRRSMPWSEAAFWLCFARWARPGLLMQSRDGTLLHGEAGERIVNHYSFYTAFTAAEEFSLAVDGKVHRHAADRPAR